MNKYIKILIGVVIGSLIGYGYYYFVGCNSTNGCPLTSNWYITTGYGALLGLVLFIPGKKKKQDIEQ